MTIKTLLDMFSYQRPAGGATERLFIAKYLKAFAPDSTGNLVLTVGDNPRILFSSHMDTVHKFDGRNKSIKYDGQFLTPNRRELPRRGRHCRRVPHARNDQRLESTASMSSISVRRKAASDQAPSREETRTSSGIST